MGRSVPVMAGARGASQMASRSYVFGRDDSNGAAAPTDGSNVQVQLLSCCCCCCHTHHLLSELYILLDSLKLICQHPQPDSKQDCLRMAV